MTQNKMDKKAAQKISDYIKNNEVETTRKGDIIVNGKTTKKSAHLLPRSLLKLNIANHRFSTAIETLKQERKDTGKSPELNMGKKSDRDEIRNMLRGIEPSNTSRKTQYDKLLQEVKEYSIENSGNGLTELTIVTADGIYINGNRRDTVLEDLTEQENKKKKGAFPQKYEKIDVIVCPDTITASDIRQMELKEQVSLSLRDEYDKMNTALLIKEEYDTLLAGKGPGKENEVLNIIASRITGKDKKHVSDYLKFLEFVNLVLIALDKEGDYYKINTKTDDEKDSQPVTTICIEFQRQWEKVATPKQKANIVLQCAAYCQGVFSKTKPGPGDYKFTARNHRILKSALNKKSAKQVMDNYDLSKHDYSSDADAKKFGDMLQQVEDKAKNENWLETPGKLLKSIENSLFTIDDALSTSDSKKVKQRLEQAKVKRSLKLFTETIDRIEQKMKKIND